VACATPPGTDFPSALEVHKTAKSWIREAVPSGFNVTRKPVIERRVFGDRHDQVIPAIELFQRQLIFKALTRLEYLLDKVAGVGVKYINYDWTGGDIGDAPHDRTGTARIICGGNIEHCRARPDAAVEITHEAVGPINREGVSKSS
jgi:hypothetical protein